MRANSAHSVLQGAALALLPSSRHQEIDHIGLLHCFVREDLAQAGALVGEEGAGAGLAEDEKRRASADVGEMRIERDRSTPADVAARDAETRQARELDGTAVVETRSGG
jgi:hypothetical protein